MTYVISSRNIIRGFTTIINSEIFAVFMGIVFADGRNEKKISLGVFVQRREEEN